MMRTLFDKLQLAWYAVAYDSPARLTALAVVVVAVVAIVAFVATITFVG